MRTRLKRIHPKALSHSYRRLYHHRFAHLRQSHSHHTYYYRLTGVADEEKAIKDIDAVGTLKQSLKNSTSVKTYKDNKYRFAYTYRSDKDPKKILLEVVFTDKDY